MSLFRTFIATIIANFDEIPTVVHTHDAGTDLDDELAALMCVSLDKEGCIDYAATVASYGPKEPRAQLIGGLTERLGLSTVAMIGSGSGAAPKVGAYEFDLPYLLDAGQIKSSESVIAQVERIEADGRRLFLLSTADFTDTRHLIEVLGDERAARVIDRISWMGGVDKYDEERGQWLPELGVQNANYDREAATFVFDWAQRHGVTLIVTSRHAAGAAKVPFAVYKEIPDEVVAQTMSTRAAFAIRGLWEKVATFAVDPDLALEKWPKFPFKREKNPCTREWFIKAFLNGNDPGPDVGADADIWPYVCTLGGKFMAYDALAALAMFAPELPNLFAPAQRDGSSVMVIGVSETEHNLVEPAEVVQLLTELAHRAFQD